MENEKIKVYITFVQIYTPRGGDFYLSVSSSKIRSSEELKALNLNTCVNKDEVLKKIQTLDPDAKAVGGIILCKNQEVEYAGVYKQSKDDEIPVDVFLESLEEKFDEFKTAVKQDLIKKGGR